MSQITEKLELLITRINNLHDENPEMPSLWSSVLIPCLDGFVYEIKAFDELKQRVAELEGTTSTHKTVADNLQRENDYLLSENSYLWDELDRQEQRYRNMNLLIHGVPEQENEDTNERCVNIIVEYLDIEFSTNNIQYSYRMDHNKFECNVEHSRIPIRPIMMKLNDFNKREEIFNEKVLLEGTFMEITENLTQKRYNILQEAIKKLGRENVWTSGGHIIIKKDEKLRTIGSLNDLDGL